MDKTRGGEIGFGAGVTAVQGVTSMTANGAGAFIAIGSGTSFAGSTIQANDRNVAIIIGRDCRIRGLKIFARRENSVVVIGAGTTWESGAILSESGNIVALGNDCMVSNGVIIRTSDGHSIFDAQSKAQINGPEDVFIGHHVWLGNSARVGKGAIIGSGAVLGQWAIATKRLAGSSIHAGIPARTVREGILWSRTHSFDDIPEDYLIQPAKAATPNGGHRD